MRVMKCKNARTTECRNAIESMDPFGMQSPIPLTVSKEFPTRKPALREEDALQGQEMVVRNFPPFPSLELRDAFDASTLQCLVEHLEERQRLRSSLNDELTRAEGVFRVRLLELDENVHKMNTWQQHRQQCLEAKERLADSQKAKISRLNDKKKRLHCKIEDQQKAIPLHVNVKQLLQQRLNTTRLELKREHMEQHQKECRQHDTIAALGCKWQQECDRCVAAKEIEMQYKMWLKDDKLKQLKSILTDNEVTERTSYDEHYRKQTVSSCFIASKTWDCEVLDSLDHKSNSSDCISVVCCVNRCEEHIKQSDVFPDQNSEQPTLRAVLGSNGAPLNKPHANVTNPGGSEQTNEDIDRQHSGDAAEPVTRLQPCTGGKYLFRGCEDVRKEEGVVEDRKEEEKKKEENPLPSKGKKDRDVVLLGVRPTEVEGEVLVVDPMVADELSVVVPVVDPVDIALV